MSLGDTVVVLMGAARSTELVASLLTAGLDGATPVAIMIGDVAGLAVAG